jgi:uncharacterized protein HemY
LIRDAGDTARAARPLRDVTERQAEQLLIERRALGRLIASWRSLPLASHDLEPLHKIHARHRSQQRCGAGREGLIIWSAC